MLKLAEKHEYQSGKALFKKCDLYLTKKRSSIVDNAVGDDDTFHLPDFTD